MKEATERLIYEVIPRVALILSSLASSRRVNVVQISKFTSMTADEITNFFAPTPTHSPDSSIGQSFLPCSNTIPFRMNLPTNLSFNQSATSLESPETVTRRSSVLGASASEFNNSTSDLFSEDERVAAVKLTPEKIVNILHSHGINLRQMGLVRKYSTSPYVKKMILLEMCVRACRYM